MSVIAMVCTSAEEHPDADRLRVYKFEAGNFGCQIVANLTNVYEVGDVAAIAQPGTVLSAFDDLEIVPRKVRGVESFGMAIGHVDAPVGTELGDDFFVEENTG